MPDPVAWATFLTRRRWPWWTPDLCLAVLVIGAALGVIVSADEPTWGGSFEVVGLLLVLIGCAAAARSRPVAAGLAACPFVFVSNWVDPGSVGDAASAGALAVVFLLNFRVGARADLWPSLGVIVAIGVSAQAFGTFNPIIVVDTLGPWALGRAVRSRTQAQAELEERTRALEREQALQTQESVRYERTRIARELHDIVAHNVSVMVVQAGAGQYLAERESAATALDAISEQARQAGEEVGRLFALLDPETEPRALSLNDLVRQAKAGGLVVDCRWFGAAPAVPAQDAVTYRVVQEALTNAVKHAPGAAVEIVLTCASDGTTVVVTNGPASAGGQGLTSSGGGNGLAGMKERIAPYAGRLRAGPTRDGGWRVEAFLPAGVPASAERGARYGEQKPQQG